MTTCLVCDFGGSSLKYALVDSDANISNSGQMAAPLGSKEEFVEAVGMLYDRFPHVDGVAISIPGSVDPLTGTLLGSGAYQQLYGTNLPEILQERVPVNISVENDGKCAVLTEAWKGALSESQDGAVIVLGSGVAGGFLKNGALHRGADFNAGEISFMLTDPKDQSLMGSAVMTCGMLGMTYKMCKAKNLSFAYQDSSAIIEWLDTLFSDRYPQPLSEPIEVKADGHQMFRWLEEGDQDIASIYAEFISGLAVIVHNIQTSFAPERVVIGGGLSRPDRVIEDLTAELDKLYKGLDLAPGLRAEVVRSEYYEETNLVGAMHHHLTQFGLKEGI